METLKDIFVSYEIAQKLKEIGFDEPCIGAYDCYCMLHTINSNDKFSLSKNEIFAYAPTWEQVKKWFRDKGLEGYQIPNIHDNPVTYVLVIMDNSDKPIDPLKHIYQSYGTYEEAREALIYKLIEIYENGKKNR